MGIRSGFVALMVFPGETGTVLSSHVRKALRKEPPFNEEVRVAMGPRFSVESREELVALGFRVLPEGGVQEFSDARAKEPAGAARPPGRRLPSQRTNLLLQRLADFARLQAEAGWAISALLAEGLRSESWRMELIRDSDRIRYEQGLLGHKPESAPHPMLRVTWDGAARTLEIDVSKSPTPDSLLGWRQEVFRGFAPGEEGGEVNEDVLKFLGKWLAGWNVGN